MYVYRFILIGVKSYCLLIIIVYFSVDVEVDFEEVNFKFVVKKK